MPSLRITRRKDSNSVIKIEKLPGQDKNQIYDDPFTMRMKEIGVDWNKLQDGAEIEIDIDR